MCGALPSLIYKRSSYMTCNSYIYTCRQLISLSFYFKIPFAEWMLKFKTLSKG